MTDEIHEPENPELSEGQEFHTVIGQDPWLEEFARSPYDPINSARATGRLTGLAARQIYRKGWMRVAAFLVGFGMVSSGFGVVVVMITTRQVGDVLFAIAFATIGARLILHAVGR